MTTPTKTVDEIISKTGYDCDGNFLGLSDYGAKQSLRTLVEKAFDEVIGEEIEYGKYEKCPSCPAAMMYQCTCDSGSLYTVMQQRQRAKAKLTEMFGEEK